MKSQFHTYGNWFWEREEDGSVAVYLDHPGGMQELLHRLTPDMWASVVASVSKGDEIDERFYAAKAFHDSIGRVKIVEIK